MATTPQLDRLEADARKRFDMKKAEAVACEARIAKEQTSLAEMTQELARIQGEFRTIQNLRKQAEKLPAKKK